MTRLATEHLSVGYAGVEIVHGLSVKIPDGKVTTIIGPNGCGKSTFLRALARLLEPRGGSVLLDGQQIHHLPTWEEARRLGLLPQQPTPPGGLTVEDLVGRGRYPHQGFLQPPSKQDAEAVDRALALAGMITLRNRPVDNLSGGQRQRAWIAMTLAQETPVLLFDEPTTFLDLAAQIGLLDLARSLNRTEGRSIIMILHDLNLAARYADEIVAMKDGEIAAAGPPAQVITRELLRTVFDVEADIIPDPVTGAPLILPRCLAGEDAAISEEAPRLPKATNAGQLVGAHASAL